MNGNRVRKVHKVYKVHKGSLAIGGTYTMRVIRRRVTGFLSIIILLEAIFNHRQRNRKEAETQWGSVTPDSIRGLHLSAW